jgi:hypothetical protein
MEHAWERKEIRQNVDEKNGRKESTWKTHV